jgi:hypothetical protein
MGIDVHRATSVVVMLDSKGKVVLETVVATKAAAMIRLLRAIDGLLHVTFEETIKAVVLGSLRSPESQRGYRHAIDEFIAWYCSAPRLPLRSCGARN